MPSELEQQLQDAVGAAYRIERELGGAGMSRVFVATETDLDRQVVVKLLPPDLAAGVNVDRFRREIQLAARLQHPHIVPLLTAGARGSLLYYTMPFIEGESLRTRITRARELPVPEATRILREVADALGYAHSKGVVHRDIKPENIIISGNHALVLDFGVSKALSSATSESPASPSTLTSTGMALGTPAYMAPEQVAADPNTDHRADLYSVGVLGYELLSGRTPFAGLNQQQTLSAHITTHPAPVTQHRPQLPPGLAHVVMKCLEKHPSDRFQSAGELHDALEPFSFTSGATAPSIALPPARDFAWTPQRIAVTAGIAGLIVTGLIASTIAFKRESYDLTVSNTRQLTNIAGLEILPAISPDGRMIAYASRETGRYAVYVRQLSGGRAVMVGDSGAAFPTWSPDGTKVLFSRRVRGGATYVVPALGGPPSEIVGLDGLDGCSWSNKGDRVACTEIATGALAIVAINGEGRRTIKATAGPEGSRLPRWSRDDRTIAFARGNSDYYIGENIGNFAPSSVWLVDADGGRLSQITDNINLNTSPIWTPDGSLMFVSTLGGNRDIYLQRITSDLKRRGAPVRLTTGLNAHTISLDRSGKILSYSSFSTFSNVWAAPVSSTGEGDFKAVTQGNQTIEAFAVSADGAWLVYDSNVNGKQHIFKVPLSGGEPQQLTANNADNFSPEWSPDGSEISFHTLERGNRDIHVMSAAGGKSNPAAATASEELGARWSSDGKSLLYLVLPDSAFTITREVNGRWGKARFLDHAFYADFDPQGSAVLVMGLGGNQCTGRCGYDLVSPDFRNPQRLRTPKIDSVFRRLGGLAWSRSSGRAYASIREKSGLSSIWQLPVNGGDERRIVHFTDPGRQLFRNAIDAEGNNIYFTIGDRQSDIWTLELEKR